MTAPVTWSLTALCSDVAASASTAYCPCTHDYLTGEAATLQPCALALCPRGHGSQVLHAAQTDHGLPV